MKKSLKLGLGGAALVVGLFALASCTASYCTVTDKAHILYLFDYGVTEYHETNVEGSEALTIKVNGTEYTTNLFSTTSFDNGVYLSKIKTAATSDSVRTPSINYFAAFDQVVLNHVIDQAISEDDALLKDGSIVIDSTGKTITFGDIGAGALLCPADKYEDYSNNKGLLDKYGYIKYEGSVDGKLTLWTNWTSYNQEVRASGDVAIDECASSDFVSFYQKKMNSYISSYRSCLAISDGDYGAYGPHSLPAEIEGKKWTYWKGLLEFLFVWPIGALIDVLDTAFAGIGGGWSSLLAILIVTVIIRGIMLSVTFSQQKSSAVMTELQPEMTKIQNKYPNANTNKMEKQRMSQEMAKFYKKHKINPLKSMLVMFIQFPVFICVWGAMQGSACLSTGSVLGLRLSDSIGATIFSGAHWASIGSGGFTALMLFILMAAAQTVAMLLPRWMQKKKTKNVAKLGRNPAANSQNDKMKWFTIIMLVMIILMGFSLASAMGVYWLFGALFSVGQTLITQAVVSKKHKNKKVI